MNKTEKHGEELASLETSEDTVLIYCEDNVREQWIESDYHIAVGGDNA